MRAWLVLGFAAFLLRAVHAGESGVFEVPIRVEDLPENSRAALVEARLDLASVLEGRQLEGTIDERSFELLDEGRSIPFQFLADSQARIPRRPILPGTPPSVSFAGEFPPGEGPIRVRGTLVWMARTGAGQRQKTFRFRFSMRATGSFVQVPYAPEGLVHFDETQRAQSPRWFPEVQVRPLLPLERKISVYLLKERFTTYYLGPSRSAVQEQVRRPFLYPVNGSDGVSVTEFGKPHDPTGSHAHHNSIWIAHNSVDGRDFWSDRGGTIEHEKILELEDGPVFARFAHQTRWIFQGEELLRETRAFTFYNSPASERFFDVRLRFTPARTNDVTFGQTSFGFLAARAAASMTVFDGGGEIRNSAGGLNERQVHLKNASWLDQSGPILPGKWAGITMFDHPKNAHYPTVWHCRNDGWAGAAFNANEPYHLAPGKTLELRYRVLIHDGNAAAANLDQRALEFAASPKASVLIDQVIRLNAGKKPEGSP